MKKYFIVFFVFYIFISNKLSFALPYLEDLPEENRPYIVRLCRTRIVDWEATTWSDKWLNAIPVIGTIIWGAKKIVDRKGMLYAPSAEDGGYPLMLHGEFIQPYSERYYNVMWAAIRSGNLELPILVRWAPFPNNIASGEAKKYFFGEQAKYSQDMKQAKLDRERDAAKAKAFFMQACYAAKSHETEPHMSGSSHNADLANRLRSKTILSNWVSEHKDRRSLERDRVYSAHINTEGSCRHLLTKAEAVQLVSDINSGRLNIPCKPEIQHT